MYSQLHRPLKRLLLLTGLLAAGASLGDSTTNAPGSACVATGSANLTVRDDGEAENRTAAVVTAICPAERPVVTGTTTLLSGRVFVVDQSTTGSVCCRVASKNPGGTKITGAWQCSTGSSSSYQILDLAQLTDTYTFSSFYIECQLPALSGGLASRLQMYRAVQQ
ncbi:MAG TPA: hypothetical protein VFZ09_30570 [Archangium sp.]|uniref:hypothetical protein n=1 Tax=Archangium sp. TaxID=1872627 RepID=UPI002E2EB314|nr:hypothetical protein [Archangium sp.]HEX5750611.1 hypothetical protein [Archangium sp.]